MDDIKKKILIVEDNEALSDIYQARLDLEGFETKLEADGEKALAEAVEYKPDLILLDVVMPQIDGFNVLDILKNTEKTKDIKIIILTALSQVRDKEHAVELGADDFLVKSETDLDSVVECIQKHLG